MMRLILICVSAAALCACGLFDNYLSGHLFGHVNGYCRQLEPAERTLLINSLNAKLAPNSIHIHCATDAPEVKPNATQDLRNDKETTGVVRYVCTGYENYGGYTTLNCVRTGTRPAENAESYYPKPLTAPSPNGTAQPAPTIAPCLSCIDA